MNRAARPVNSYKDLVVGDSLTTCDGKELAIESSTCDVVLAVIAECNNKFLKTEKFP